MKPPGSIQIREVACPAGLTHILGKTNLYAIGNLELLGRKAIGICGSRDASEGGLMHAYEFGREAATQGAVVVSGYARGVDRQAHKGALEAGGATIAVLPEGIRYFRIIKDLRAVVDLHRNFLAVSMFEPDAPWKAWRAMERNKLIVGLSRGLFVIEASEKGGTLHAAKESERQHKPVCAVDFLEDLPGREGNRELIKGSAIPLRNLREMKRALDLILSMSELQPAAQLALSLSDASDV